MTEGDLMLAKYRSWPVCFFVALFMASFFAQSAKAQSYLRNSDIAVSAFGQFTSTADGNDVKVTPTISVGGQAAFRHVYHWWLGYEGSYGYTRFTDKYSSYPFPVQHNTHDFGGSYLLTAPKHIPLLGIKPFGFAGISALLNSPSLNGGQRASAQARAAINFGVGADFPLMTSHFGMRVQYRGLYYKTPDYGDPVFQSNTWRITNEPMIGVFLHF
jgi:hypothetical protein